MVATFVSAMRNISWMVMERLAHINQNTNALWYLFQMSKERTWSMSFSILFVTPKHIDKGKIELFKIFNNT